MKYIVIGIIFLLVFSSVEASAQKYIIKFPEKIELKSTEGMHVKVYYRDKHQEEVTSSGIIDEDFSMSFTSDDEPSEINVLINASGKPSFFSVLSRYRIMTKYNPFCKCLYQILGTEIAKEKPINWRKYYTR